jgi:glycosyltransferase involved in cell wall biosynthesis
VTNPPTLLIIIGILKKIFGFKLFVILQDIFPENAAASGILDKDSIGYSLILKTMNLGYKNADKLIACGSDMARHFVAKGIAADRVFVIPNWADHKLIIPDFAINRNDYFKSNLDGKIVLQFAGNIGRLQGLEHFIKLFGRCKNEQLILIIIGDGAHKKLLENLVEKDNLENVLFFDSKPRGEQNIFLNSCDIGLVTLCNGMYGLGVPSKVYNIMSAGKPILFIGDKNSEIDNYIRDNNVGWSYDWSEESKILDFLNNIDGEENLKKIGQDARSFALNNFTQEIILNQYKKILN